MLLWRAWAWILDKNYKPYLLEVNHSPSFTIDTPFDRDLIRDALTQIHMSERKKSKIIESLKSELVKRQYEKWISIEVRSKLKIDRIAKKIKYEQKHLGGYMLIFPTLNSSKYCRFYWWGSKGLEVIYWFCYSYKDAYNPP